MARLTPILLFTTIFNATFVNVSSWGLLGLGLIGGVSTVEGSPILVQGTATPSWAAAWIANPMLLVVTAASLLSVMFVFGNFFGALVTYIALFTTNIIIPLSILISVYHVPVISVSIIGSALWFLWLVEVLQIQSGRYLND